MAAIACALEHTAAGAAPPLVAQRPQRAYESTARYLAVAAAQRMLIDAAADEDCEVARCLIDQLAARHADSPHAYHLLHAAARAHVGVLLVRTAAHHIADMRAREELSMEVLGALQELAAHGFHASSVAAHARSVAAHAALRAI